MNRDDAEKMVIQLQQAHRLAVGFYKRILPTFDYLANQIGCQFWEWYPLYTSRPCRSSSQPSASWTWDYVPLYASGHVYGRQQDPARTCVDDLSIEFDLIIEESFDPSRRESRQQPDPISLPAGESVVKISLYRPKEDFDIPFDDLWAEPEEVEEASGRWFNSTEHFEGYRLCWPLGDLISDVQPLIDELKRLDNRVNW